MYLVLIVIVVFLAIAFLGLAKRNSTVDKAKNKLADAKALKEASILEQETKELLESLTEENNENVTK
jgi:hypothetical protein